jgi:hypothetical protein
LRWFLRSLLSRLRDQVTAQHHDDKERHDDDKKRHAANAAAIDGHGLPPQKTD